MVCFIIPLHGMLEIDNAFRFCFAPDVSRPLLELEQRFFNEQLGGNGKISKLFKFIVTDQRQFQLWQSSQNLMISSLRSMIGKKKTRRIEKLLMPP